MENSYSIKMSRCNSRISRPLGYLEKNFYEDGKIIPSMVSLSCQKTVTRFEIYSALEILVTHHPMLRMSIVGDGSTFTEIQDMSIPLYQVEAVDWFPVSKSTYKINFEENKPFWSFIHMENSFTKSKDIFQFVFTLHHSLVDFNYAYVLIMSFLNILNDIQQGKLQTQYTIYPFQPAIEDIIFLENDRIKEKQAGEKTTKTQIITTLEAYELYYKDEIMSLKDTPRIVAALSWVKIDASSADKYFAKCKSEMVSKTNAILAALVWSFGKLLRQKGCCEKVLFQFSFMTNLRRYMAKDTPFYPGMAAVACPLEVVVDVNSLSGETFWDIVRNIRDSASEAMNNQKPLHTLYNDIPNLVLNERKKGKSSTVFVLSHVDKLDSSVLNTQTAEHFRVNDFQVISDVKLDYFQIFTILTSIINGQLHIYVGFTSTYTSQDTADNFTRNISDVIHGIARNVKSVY